MLLLIGFAGLGLLGLVLVGMMLINIGRIWEVSEQDEAPWGFEQQPAELNDLDYRVEELVAIGHKALSR